MEARLEDEDADVDKILNGYGNLDPDICLQN